MRSFPRSRPTRSTFKMRAQLAARQVGRPLPPGANRQGDRYQARASVATGHSISEEHFAGSQTSACLVQCSRVYVSCPGSRAALASSPRLPALPQPPRTPITLEPDRYPYRLSYPEPEPVSRPVDRVRLCMTRPSGSMRRRCAPGGHDDRCAAPSSRARRPPNFSTPGCPDAATALLSYAHRFRHDLSPCSRGRPGAEATVSGWTSKWPEW
jgi:hypothetical protein